MRSEVRFEFDHFLVPFDLEVRSPSSWKAMLAKGVEIAPF
jgi:hypothetical protein